MFYVANGQWDMASGVCGERGEGEREKKIEKVTLAGGPSRNGAQARDKKNGLFERSEAERVSIFQRAGAQFRPSG